MATSFARKMMDVYEIDADTVPAVYTRFLENVDSYSGKSAYGFLGFTKEDPVEVTLNNTALLKSRQFFDDNDIEREEHPNLVPLACFPHEANFLIVDLGKKDCPVFIWEHETGEFEDVSRSLEDFLSKLI